MGNSDAVIEKVARAIAAASGTRLWVRAEGEAALAALEAGDTWSDGDEERWVEGASTYHLTAIRKEAADSAAEAMREACIAELEKSSGPTGVAAAIVAIRALKLLE